MTTWQQQPIDSVQVPQAMGLSPEVAFNVVGQAGLAPMFQAQPVDGQLPGVPSQWGQVPASFTGQPVTSQAHVISQNPLPGAWVPRGSVVYMEWAEVGAAEPKKSSAGWLVATLLGVLVIVIVAVYFLVGGGDDPQPEPSRTPTATTTVTQTPAPRPTRTVTETATQTATQTATATATATETAAPTVTTTP